MQRGCEIRVKRYKRVQRVLRKGCKGGGIPSAIPGEEVQRGCKIGTKGG